MKNNSLPLGCACCRMNRRGFLAATGAVCAAGAAGVLAGCASTTERAGGEARMRIRIIYSLHEPKQNRPDWPNKGFDFVPVMERINGELARQCPQFQFVTSLATGPEQAKAIVEEDKTANIDGYIVYQMNCWNRVVQTIADSGKPVLYADFQFGGSGGFLVYTAGFLRSKAPNVGFVASSQFKDVVKAVKCFELVKKGGSVSDFVAATAQVRLAATPTAGKLACTPDPLQTLSPEECLKRMKASKILAFRGQETGPAGTMFEIPVLNVPFTELNDAWKSADKDEAKAVADRWQKTAKVVKDVSRETLETSAAMYLAEKAMLKKYDANGITINCLGGFYSGQIQAYPCLGFHQLNNEGLVGGCECDVRSAATMVAFGIMTKGRPGYISDPILDSSKRQIVYAHCVSSNKAFGQEGRANPFEILTHSEDRQGASVRSILPLGYMTTTLEVAQERKEILMHRAKAVANDPDDRACRTKLCGEPVGDFEKLFSAWDQWGWHRVTFYGDLKEPVKALADLTGWKVIDEA